MIHVSCGLQTSVSYLNVYVGVPSEWDYGHLHYKCYKLRGNPAKGGRYELGFRFGTSLIRSAACSAFWSWDRIFRGAANPIPASI